MQAIKIKKHLTSDTVCFPELRDMIGKYVEFIILVESYEEKRMPERTPGTAKGFIQISDDFEAPLPEAITEEFYK
ncbi:MAG: hypothetical protein AB7S75_12050 [Desulfococcaceae bacterium]